MQRMGWLKFKYHQPATPAKSAIHIRAGDIDNIIASDEAHGPVWLCVSMSPALFLKKCSLKTE